MSTEKRLLEMKDQIEKAKQEASKTEGILSQLYETLENEFGVKTLEEAEALLAKLEDEEKGLTTEFDGLVESLERDYKW